MAKIIVEADCGNAPRKLFLKEFYSALANADHGFIKGQLLEEISWVLPDSSEITGKEKFLQKIKTKIPPGAGELLIELIITHGPHAAVSGTISLSDGKIYSFCDIYNFGTAGASKIKSIKSFLLKAGKKKH